MRNLFVSLLPFAFAACTPVAGGDIPSVGEDVTPDFQFRSDAIGHWEYINLDESVSYKLYADQNEGVESSPTGQIFAVNWTKECVAEDPYCIDGVGKTVKWEVDLGKGVFITGKQDAADENGNIAPEVDYAPPIQLASGDMEPGDTISTVTNGFTFTSTYQGYDTCPVRWSTANWGDECVKLSLSDGDVDPVTNEGLVGDYWAILGFNLVAFQGDTDDDIWELNDYKCAGAGC
jgi:hypothetical protein